LARWRLDQGLSQTAAGDLVGVSQVTWSDWESGKKCPHVGQAVKLERVTGVPCEAWEALADEQRRRLQQRRAAVDPGQDVAAQAPDETGTHRVCDCEKATRCAGSEG
jgi:DNA-binding XRE family transcriptional regulator